MPRLWEIYREKTKMTHKKVGEMLNRGKKLEFTFKLDNGLSLRLFVFRLDVHELLARKRHVVSVFKDNESLA